MIFNPLKLHFNIVKFGFTGVYIFVILLKNIDCGYSLEPPRRGGSNEYTQSMLRAKVWKISEFFIWKFSFFGGKIFIIFEQACFRNGKMPHLIRIYSLPPDEKCPDTEIGIKTDIIVLMYRW